MSWYLSIIKNMLVRKKITFPLTEHDRLFKDISLLDKTILADVLNRKTFPLGAAFSFIVFFNNRLEVAVKEQENITHNALLRMYLGCVIVALKVDCKDRKSTDFTHAAKFALKNPLIDLNYIINVESEIFNKLNWKFAIMDEQVVIDVLKEYGSPTELDCVLKESQSSEYRYAENYSKIINEILEAEAAPMDVGKMKLKF